MSDVTFSVYRNDNSECLIADVDMQEASARANAYYARGGKSGLTFVRKGDEFKPPKPVEVTVVEPQPLEGEPRRTSQPAAGPRPP